MRLILAVILVASTVLVGCIPTETSKTDKDLAPVDYLKAVEHYDKVLYEAIAKEREAIAFRKETEKKFSQAKIVLVSDYLNRAAVLAANNEKNCSVALGEAISHLESIKKWDDKDSRLDGMLAQYQEEKAELDADLARLEEQFTGYRFGEAGQTVLKLLAKRPANKELLEKKELITKLNAAYTTFQQQLTAGELKKAHDTGLALAKILPSNMDFNKSAARSDLIAAIKAEAQALTDKKEYVAAIDFLKQFELSEFDQLITEAIEAKAKLLTQEKKYSAAVAFLKQFEPPQFDNLIDKIRTTGSNDYYSRALQEDTAGNTYLSYLLLKKADTFQNASTAAKKKDNVRFNLQKKNDDFVDQALQEYIAIASFDSPSHDPDAGLQFSDSLTSYLYDVLPYGINILERDKIDLILKERKQSNNIGRMLGANLVVTGRVSLFKIETSEDKRTATAKVVTGEKVVPNPEYTRMMSQYGTDTKKWPSVPAATMVNKTHQLISYNKGTARLKGFAKVSVRIFDTSKSAISFVKDYPAAIEDVSEFQDEVKAANIPYIPKKLMSSIEAKAAMRNEIVAAIGKVVQSSFNQRERRFLEQAKHMLQRREKQKAVESLAKGYHYCMRDRIPADNAAFIEMLKAIDTVLD